MRRFKSTLGSLLCLLAIVSVAFAPATVAAQAKPAGAPPS